VAVIVCLFTGLIVLPISLGTDLVLRYIPVRRARTQIVCFLLTGILTGVVVGTAWSVFKPHPYEFVAGAILFLACTSSISVFGFTLTMAETVRTILKKAVRSITQPSVPQLAADH
jgi:hypothetical protein